MERGWEGEGESNRSAREVEIDKRAKFRGPDLPTKKSVKLSSHGIMT